MKVKNPHARIDLINKEMDRLVAERIRADPEVVKIAKANLQRWKRQNGGELAPAHQEWDLALRFLTPNELADFVESEAPKAKRLRQSSPFAGVLNEAERLTLLP